MRISCRHLSRHAHWPVSRSYRSDCFDSILSSGKSIPAIDRRANESGKALTLRKFTAPLYTCTSRLESYFKSDGFDASTAERYSHRATHENRTARHAERVNSPRPRVSYFFGIQFHIPLATKKRKLCLLSGGREKRGRKRDEDGRRGGERWKQRDGMPEWPRNPGAQCLRSHHFNYFVFFRAALRLSRNPPADAENAIFARLRGETRARILAARGP